MRLLSYRGVVWGTFAYDESTARSNSPKSACGHRSILKKRNTAPSAGLAAAHDQGVAIGRPQGLTPEQILMGEAMTADPAISTHQVAEQCGVHRSTLHQHPTLV